MGKQTVVHPYNKYNLTIKINELSNHENTRRKFKCILLSERNQSKKVTYSMITTNDMEEAKL